MAISRQDLKRLQNLYPFHELKYIYDEDDQPSSVLITMEDFIGLLETLDILSNEDLSASIRKGLEEIKSGTQLLNHSEVFGDL